MKNIFFNFFIIYILIKNAIICYDIEIWRYISSTILTFPDTTYTGFTYLYENNNYLASYIYKKTSYFQNFISNEKLELNDKLYPMSYSMNCGYSILLTENNCIYTNINSNFQKIETNIKGAKSLKGYLIYLYSEFLVAFIGTDNLIIFKNDENKLVIKKSFNFVGNEIVGLHATKNNYIDYINLIFKKDNCYISTVYTLFDNDLYMLNNNTLNIEFNDNIEIYKIFNNNLVYNYIFSYNKNENNFVFYFLEFNSETQNYTFKKSGNKYNFLPFQNAIIINAFFLPNTEFLYYLIQIDKEKYAGVFDIINNLIIFNFKTITEFISFQNFFLIYSENNFIYRVCPFNIKDENDCPLYIDNNRQLVQISNNINTIISQCNNDAPYLLGGVYCYESCPLGYHNSGKICEKCSIFDNDSEECVSSCKEWQIYDELNKICYSCKPFNQYKNKNLNKCVDDCSIYNLIKDEDNYICNSCQELGKYFQDGKCVDNCGPAHIKDEDRKICAICNKETPYYQNGECVKECEKKYTLDIKTKRCILCTTKEPYLQDGECVEKCEKNYKIDYINKTCINCQNDTNGPFLQNNECVFKCNFNYKIDEFNYICINCQNETDGTSYLQNNECVEKCDNNYKRDETNKICINCQSIDGTPYLQNNECVKECDKYYKIDKDKKVCINCQLDTNGTPFLQENECVTKCGNYYKIDNNNKYCINCQKDLPSTPYYQEGECVSKCNKNYQIDTTKKICTNCQKNSPKTPYLQDNQCVAKCNDYYALDNSLMRCYNCSELGNDYYFYNGTCVKECPNYYIKDEINKRCYKCDENSENRYYENGKCVNKCNLKYVVDEVNKICYKCQDKNKNIPYNENGKCVQKCSQYLAIDFEDYLCINCTDKNGTFYQNNSCVKNCSPGYVIAPSTYSCSNCFKEYNEYEFEGKCYEICPNYTVNNPEVNQCQYCYTYNKSKPFYDTLNKKCVSECPIGTEKSSYLCIECLKFYNIITKKCVDNCPTGSAPDGKICQKCNIYDLISNTCVSQCSKGEYPYYIKEDNYSLCYQGFCGYGTCLLNESNYKNDQKTININNLYSCQCNNKQIFGKYCQFKNVIQKNNIIQIKPLQDIIYVNKKNIFFFELINNNTINSLRKLSINHTQYITRRFQYYITWELNQKNCNKNLYKEIISNELYFIIEPDTFLDDCDNIIQLNISDENNKILASARLYVRTKTIKKDNFNLSLFVKDKMVNDILDINSLFGLKLDKLKEIKENYIYKYIYITDDGEEFSLTNYMNNFDIYQKFILPYCHMIKVRIKNDYGDTVDILSEQINFNKEENKNLSIILNNYNIENITSESVWQLMTELKTFFSLNNKYPYNNTLDKYLNTIITILGEYLPIYIANENNKLTNVDSLCDIEDKIEPNLFISVINQLILFYYNKSNNEEDNYNLYIDINTIIFKSLNNKIIIESLSEETILSYIRTIDNLLLIMNEHKNISNLNFYQLYTCIDLLKNIFSKHMVAGTKLKLNGYNLNIYLFKPGYYTEELSINDEKIKKENNVKKFMQYNNYKIEYFNIIKTSKQCGSDSIFCISRENYDYLYDELTYLKNENITDLIFSIIRINNKHSLISNWNTFTKNIYIKNNYEIPKILEYSFIIQIENPINKNIISNLKKFRYNLTFDLLNEYENYKQYITCLPFNSIIINNDNIELSNEQICITYIDSEAGKIICDCNTNGEIIVVIDKNISSLSKNIIYKQSEYKILNTLSGSIILSSLALITIFSVLFIFYEFYEDDKNSYINVMNSSMRAQNEYENFKNLKYSSKCLFALYLIYYKYSFFNVFSTYKYNHPRYIRFFFEIIKILLNILISIIPLYCMRWRIGEDSINQYDSGIFNLYDSLKSFLYSLIASILIFFIFQIIYKIFEYKKIRRLIWKPKKDILKQWIYSYFKKEAIFDKKFKSVKIKMNAFVKLCGKYIITNKKNDKFSKYLEYKFSQKNPSLTIHKYDFDDFSICKINTSTIINDSSNKLPSLKEKLIIKCNTDKELKVDLYKNYSINTKTNMDKKNKQLIISKGVRPFTLPEKTKINISMWNIHRLESIRNKYIYLKKDYYKNNNSKIIKYIDLSIQTQKNYSYILSNNLSFNELSTAYNKSKINSIRLINLSLFIILLIIDTAIVIMMNKVYEVYENYIIINWLFPLLIQIIFINFMINYIFALFSSFLLFAYYKKRNNNCFCNCIFNIFVEKYMRYLFKIRALINNYYREFEDMK